MCLKLFEVNHYVYTLERFTHDFSKVNSMKKYCYLLYVMSRNETPDIHILICDTLMFIDTFFMTFTLSYVGI